MDPGSVSGLIYCLSCVFPPLCKLSVTDRNKEDFLETFLRRGEKPLDLEAQ